MLCYSISSGLLKLKNMESGRDDKDIETFLWCFDNGEIYCKTIFGEFILETFESTMMKLVRR